MSKSETTSRTGLQIAADDPIIRDQIERFMADRMRCMPSERAYLESFGFIARQVNEKLMADQNTTTPPIPISARLYEELKEYLAMEIDFAAGQLLRRLREANERSP